MLSSIALGIPHSHLVLTLEKLGRGKFAKSNECCKVSRSTIDYSCQAPDEVDEGKPMWSLPDHAGLQPASALAMLTGANGVQQHLEGTMLATCGADT